MYCMNCGAENNDTFKFCVACGHSLQKGQQLGVSTSNSEIESAPASQIKSTDIAGRNERTKTLGSTLTTIAAVIAIVGFFLPWATVSCGGIYGTATGLDVSRGVINTNYGPNEDLQAQPELLLVPIAAVVVLLIGLVFYAMRHVSVWGLLVQVSAAIGGLFLIWDALDSIKHYVAEYVSVSTEPGFLATVGGLIGIIVGAVMSLLEIVFHRRRHAEEDTAQPVARQR